MSEPDKILKVGGLIDIEVAGHSLTIVGTGGTVVVTTTDLRGTKAYVYHPVMGWSELLNATKEGGHEGTLAA